ncbi:hypothetical protein FE257_000887 [Aspergillus nanangensis]|uniref:Uncharacterized protein n=1 Tax=Aspergillus nanangensis TaxID=2582783 RepID=A0AAD4CER3_ASPNN|nr:hypothetical protein FE257_000887 [Aspergillus nanangensis]
MADSSHIYDLPSWSFVEPIDASFMGISDDHLENNMMTPFELPEWDLAAMEQLEAIHYPTKPEGCLPAQANSSSIFTDLKTAKDMIATQDFSFDLDELLRSTSQMATERALFMTTPTTTTTTTTSPSSMGLYASPMMDPCSSPDGGSHWSSSSVSEADWEREMGATAGVHAPPFYTLPDATFIQQQQQQQKHKQPEEEGLLTPLEMPDGSTRFTSNWLPVDPQGGFTIGPEAPFSCDLEYPTYSQDAFISIDQTV